MSLELATELNSHVSSIILFVIGEFVESHLGAVLAGPAAPPAALAGPITAPALIAGPSGSIAAGPAGVGSILRADGHW